MVPGTDMMPQMGIKGDNGCCNDSIFSVMADENDNKVVNLNPKNSGKPPKSFSALRHCTSSSLLASVAEPVRFMYSSELHFIVHLMLMFIYVQALSVSFGWMNLIVMMNPL